jgi:transposase
MANRRFEMHEIRQVIVQMRLGLTDRQIAKAGLMGRRKASELRRIASELGWLDKESLLPENATLASLLGQRPLRKITPALILPYRDQVTRWWSEGIKGTTIHQALVRNHGFKGGYGCVKRFLKGLKRDNPKATVMLEFDPGEAAQVDFGKGPTIVDANTGEVHNTWFFVMTLAWSRHQWAELVTDQKVATWLGCHRRAFEWFGGVPSKVIIDNPKCAITRACYHDPEVQRAYGEFAEGYGFLISPCPPRDAKKKGIVESGVKYIKGSFLPLRQFRSLPEANRQLMEWVVEAAGNRIHGTTRERPMRRFVEVERDLLRPLAEIPPELASWSQLTLHGNCHIQFEYCYYSAPYRLLHKRLWVRATEKTVQIFHNHELVAIHPRLHKAGSRSTVDEHLPPEAIAYKMRDPQWCLKQAAQIGPKCLELIEALFANRVLDNLKAAQGIISKAKKYGPSRLEAACARAILFDDPRYRTVKTILERGLDQLPLEPPRAPLPGVYTGSGRFTRGSRDLLH